EFFTPYISVSSASRCFGCRQPSSDCTVPCPTPQRCFLRGITSLSNKDYIVSTTAKTLSRNASLGRTAIAIIEEDKRCFACQSINNAGCIVPCHYNQR
ncbi:unnamed protein product, partial [Didymodactylos carnosus]